MSGCHGEPIRGTAVVAMWGRDSDGEQAVVI